MLLLQKETFIANGAPDRLLDGAEPSESSDFLDGLSRLRRKPDRDSRIFRGFGHFISSWIYGRGDGAAHQSGTILASQASHEGT
jgi:hypothetical protein